MTEITTGTTDRLHVHPEAGQPFAHPDLPPEMLTGFVVGRCGHPVAQTEWRAGLRTCERCPAGDYVLEAADQVADRVLPLSGPHDPQRAVAAADLIAELVRRLNHATLDSDMLADPGDLDRLLGGLHDALTRLPQTVGQIAEHLRRLAGATTRFGANQGAIDLSAAANSMVTAVAAANRAGEAVGTARARATLAFGPYQDDAPLSNASPSRDRTT